MIEMGAGNAAQTCRSNKLKLKEIYFSEFKLWCFLSCEVGENVFYSECSQSLDCLSLCHSYSTRINNIGPPAGAIKCSKETKITAPPNECCNIPF